jgi:mannan polymerase II complex MNN10 subunit
MIERIINKGKHDWIWWLDFDTLFTNMKLPVETVIKEFAGDQEGVDFLLTADW